MLGIQVLFSLDKIMGSRLYIYKLYIVGHGGALVENLYLDIIEP